MLGNLLLYSGVAGLTCCSVFLLLVCIAAIFRRHAAQPHAPDAIARVTLLKPLCGLEPGLEDNLASFFDQDYPDYEIVFAARHAADPALVIARRLSSQYAHVPTRIVISGEPAYPNAKVCSLQAMRPEATGQYLVISDSDVRVSRSYVRHVVQAFADPRVGLVTCLYRGVPSSSFWSTLEALGMSIEMTSGVIVANMLEGMRFALGPTMAIRRDVLTTIGGFGVLARYCADDYVLGQKVFEHGYKVALSNHVIDHIVISRDFVPSLSHQLRWMRSTRFSRGLAHVGSGLTFAIPFGLLAAAGALLNSQPAWAAGLFGIAFLNRVALSLIAGWGVVRDPRALSYFWLYPLRDLIGFLLWCASFLGDTIVWRDQEYRLEPGGRMRRVDEHLTQPEQESESITVDNLA